MRFSLILLCFFTSITICLEDGISHFTVAVALYCPYKKTWWYRAELVEDEYDDGRIPKEPKEATVTGQLQFFTLEADFEEKDGTRGGGNRSQTYLYKRRIREKVRETK